jgi:hypothetical protein
MDHQNSKGNSIEQEPAQASCKAWAGATTEQPARSIAEVLANKPMWQIEGTAKRVGENRSSEFSSSKSFTFSDGSFIEVDRWGQRQIFLANGWNVTQDKKA